MTDERRVLIRKARENIRLINEALPIDPTRPTLRLVPSNGRAEDSEWVDLKAGDVTVNDKALDYEGAYDLSKTLLKLFGIYCK